MSFILYVNSNTHRRHARRRACDVHQGWSRRRARASRASPLDGRRRRRIDVFLIDAAERVDAQTQDDVRAPISIAIGKDVADRSSDAGTRVRAHADGGGGDGVFDAKGRQHRALRTVRRVAVSRRTRVRDVVLKQSM